MKGYFPFLFTPETLSVTSGPESMTVKGICHYILVIMIQIYYLNFWIGNQIITNLLGLYNKVVHLCFGVI